MLPVLLISRTDTKLEATAAEVRALGVECDWLAVDMSLGEEIYPVVRAFLANWKKAVAESNLPTPDPAYVPSVQYQGSRP